MITCLHSAASKVRKRIIESSRFTIPNRKVFDVTFPPTNIAAITIHIYSYKQVNVKVKEVTNIERPLCTYNESSQKSSSQLIYVWQIKCTARTISHKRVHFIRFQFDSELDKQDLFGDPLLELFAIDDKCKEPDVPLNATHSHRDVRDSKDVEAIVEYSCHSGYQLSSSMINYCVEAGDWQLKELPECVLIESSDSFSNNSVLAPITNPLLESLKTKFYYLAAAVVTAIVIIIVLVLLIVCRKRSQRESRTRKAAHNSKDAKALVDSKSQNKSAARSTSTSPSIGGVTKKSAKKRVAPVPPVAHKGETRCHYEKVSPTAPAATEELLPVDNLTRLPPYNPTYVSPKAGNTRVTVVIEKDERGGSKVTVQ
ncbi:hypothetical protein B4U80_13242 [Leptotrombidium deliense]|uniref:Sushi domain-containing protein n=1 Tax=Leptotrombidium deliense TaxID=299467 RepID=A0A443S9T2_9ACAR|nr:hypothetical protein B4U80_13242 [Leptotrombidium deliense]